MDNLFYTKAQLDVFTQDLHGTFLQSGFEVIEEPYIDYALYGFRATYIRRYFLQRPTPLHDGILATIVHVVGLPFHSGQKMVVLSAPRDINNEPISETLKLRIHFDSNGNHSVFHTDHNHNVKVSAEATGSENNKMRNKSNQSQWTATTELSEGSKTLGQFAIDLESYIAHIIETISPGLIQLPTEMKVEILKKLSVDSIIRMSQVNNEFRTIIFQRGESLWRHLCLRDFNIKTINRSVHYSWMALYRDHYIMTQLEICRKERALPGPPERPALPPVPYRLQIEWLPEVLELPFYPLNDAGQHNLQYYD